MLFHEKARKITNYFLYTQIFCNFVADFMRFCDIIGQEDVKRRLRLSVQENRIPHAQLLYGEQGVGKLQLAIAYAQYLACKNRTAEDSCGVCPTCLQYEKLQHPDLHFAFPIIKTDSSKEAVCNDYIGKFREIVLDRRYFSLNDWLQYIGAQNKQGIIYEAESSEILRKLSLKAFGDGFKVMIIWMPEKMHTACANKLLKILEEPPEGTVFLLVSEDPSLLLSTILSRTQQIKVPRIEEKDIIKALCEQSQDEDMDITTAASIAHIASGSWLKAMQIVSENETNTQNLQAFIQLMRNAWQVGARKKYDSLIELRNWCSEMSTKGREQIKSFLLFAQRQIRENFIRNAALPEINYQTPAEAQFSEKFAPFINENNVEKMMQELDTAQKQIEQNGNAKIILFDLCLQFIVLLKN